MPLRKKVKHPPASCTSFLSASAMSPAHFETVAEDSTDAPGRNIGTVRSERNNGFIQSIAGVGTFRRASMMDMPATVDPVTSDVTGRPARCHQPLRRAAQHCRRHPPQQNGGVIDVWTA